MDHNFAEFIDRAKELGAFKAKIIKTNTIKTGAWVRMKCRYGCFFYNTKHCCPPNTPTPKETQEVIDSYDKALLVHCKPGVKATKIMAKLEKEIFLSGYYKAFGFGEGPCQLCEVCNKDKCVRPYRARPAMEACGIDVYATARANGFPIEVVKNRNCEQNYYGLVLIE